MVHSAVFGRVPKTPLTHLISKYATSIRKPAGAVYRRHVRKRTPKSGKAWTAYGEREIQFAAEAAQVAALS